MERFVGIALVAVSAFLVLAEAKKAGHFNCKAIHCDYCGTERMKGDCAGYCRDDCGFVPTTLPPKPKLTADQKFTRCCKRKQNEGLIEDPNCLTFCTYEGLSKKNLVNAYFKGHCKGRQSAEVFYCASAGQEQKACCENYPTANAFKGRLGMCLPLCDPNAPQSTDPKLLPCLDNLVTLRECYKKHVASLPDDQF